MIHSILLAKRTIRVVGAYREISAEAVLIITNIISINLVGREMVSTFGKPENSNSSKEEIPEK